MESCEEGKISKSCRGRNLLCSRCGSESRYSMLSLDYHYSLLYSLSPKNSPGSDVQPCNGTPNLQSSQFSRPWKVSRRCPPCPCMTSPMSSLLFNTSALEQSLMCLVPSTIACRCKSMTGGKTIHLRAKNATGLRNARHWVLNWVARVGLVSFNSSFGVGHLRRLQRSKTSNVRGWRQINNGRTYDSLRYSEVIASCLK